eukprot:12916960-Prorocentrum_lima.AAC.1
MPRQLWVPSSRSHSSSSTRRMSALRADPPCVSRRNSWPTPHPPPEKVSLAVCQCARHEP